MLTSELGNFALTQQIAMLLEDFKIDGKLTPQQVQKLVILNTELANRIDRAVHA